MNCFFEKVGMEASDHPRECGRSKAHAHGASVIVAATTPNLAAALSASHINNNNDVYVDNTRVYMTMIS